jgi:penicillin-binding protein 1A
MSMNKNTFDEKKFNKKFWIIFASPFALMALLLLLAAVGGLGHMPDIEALENPKINLASQVISEDGKMLGSFYYKNQNRTYVDYDELPDHLIKALIATEDKRFYQHSGVDAKGLARVVVKTVLLFQKSSGGGSTITQQLAKLLFHKPPKTFVGRIFQKIKEWIIAVRLERWYTKEEIIAMYFNQCDFINQAVGIKSAAQVYFSTSPDSLSIEQGAMLVGMAKNPAYFNPNDSNKLARVKGRRNVVLDQMRKLHYITRTQADSLKGLPLGLKFQRISHDEGLATYFREFLHRTLTAEEPKRRNYSDYNLYHEDSLRWANDPLYGWCTKNKKPDGEAYNLYTDGLKIFTTVNSKMQKYAEDAVKEHLGGFLQPNFFKDKKGSKVAPFSRDLSDKDIEAILTRAALNSDHGRSLKDQGMSPREIMKEFKKPVHMKVFSWRGEIDTVMSPLDSIRYYKHFFQSGLMAMDPTSGFVKAYVGGINFSNFKYDHVTQSKRQAGSTFKPFLYILAMQEGMSPCTEVPNISQTFRVGDSIWTPQSSGRKEDLGLMKTLKWGLATSENNISAWLVKQFNPKPIADIAHKMGIVSYIDPVPSMIYGTSDMTVAEMVSSYCTFANKGVHTNPIYVSRIEDKNGNVLYEAQPEQSEAISSQTAYLMLNLMEGVTGPGGTAYRLRFRYNFTAQIAGKTGTTQNHSDGWMIGITPKLVAGTWVGAEDRSVHFNRMDMGQGATMALPIYALFMQKVYADKSLGITQADEFELPEGMSAIPNCRDMTGQSATDEEYWENEFVE